MRFVGLAALLSVFCSPLLAQRSDADALKLLDRVVAHYQDAETVHLEATVSGHFHTDFSDQTSTSIRTAYVAPGGRFRYEGADSSGSGLIVSDGTTEWRLLRSFAEYAQEPTGTYFHSRIMLAGDDRSMLEARDLLQGLTTLGTNIRSAHFSPDESLDFQGKKVRCAVLHFGTPDSTTRRAGDSTSETILWIDPASLTVLKEEFRSHGRFLYGLHPAPFGRVTDNVTTTTFRVVELGFEPKPDTFTFVPPDDSKEVAKLPSPFPNDANSAGKGPTPAEQLAIDHIGKQLPAIVLHDTNGADVPLAKFAGHPLLIDFWATWCGPCVTELPALDHIRKSTAGSDLQMIGVDEDTQPGVAADLLKRRAYEWQDFHYDRNITRALPTTGIPLIVLADATGKIVYYHTGADDPDGLAKAIAKLGKQYESVRVD